MNKGKKENANMNYVPMISEITQTNNHILYFTDFSYCIFQSF
jgi:hypothetical protein